MKINPFKIVHIRVSLWLFTGLILIQNVGCQVGKNSTSLNSNLHDEINKDEKMTEIQKKAEALLHLKDEEYFSIGDSELLAMKQNLGLLTSSDDDEEEDDDDIQSFQEPVLAIGLPKIVNEVNDQSVPVLVGNIRNGKRKWQVDYAQNFWFFLCNNSTAEVVLSKPFFMDKRAVTRKPSGSGEGPSRSSAMATYTGLSNIDLKVLYSNIDWNPGIYYINAIYYDWLSNVEKIEMTNEERKYPSIPFEILQPRLELFETVHIPHEANNTDDIGIDIHFLSSLIKDGSLPYAVSLNLKADECLITKNNNENYFVLTIIMVQLDDISPIEINLAVPVETYLNKEGVKMIKGNFVVDLKRASSNRHLEGTYMSYLISGPFVSNPVKISIQ